MPNRTYLFSEKLLRQLRLNSHGYPSKERLRRYLKERFDGQVGIKSDFIFDAKLGRPTSKKVLTLLLTYLQEEQPQFANELLEEDWSGLAIEDIVTRHVRPVPSDYVVAETKKDLIRLGPHAILGDLFLRGSGPAKSGPLQLTDVPAAADTMALMVGDSINEDVYLPPAGESREIGYEAIGLSPDGVQNMMRAWINHHPNSVWFKRNSDPTRHLLSMILPLGDEAYHAFRSGIVSDNEVTEFEPRSVSAKLLMNMLAGDLRYQSNAGQWSLMTMGLRQLATVTTPVSETGLNILALCPCPQAKTRLEKWHFMGTGNPMRRTGLEIAELTLEKTPPPMSLKTALWACILFYQSLAYLNRRKIEGDKAD